MVEPYPISELEKILNIEFKDKSLLKLALTHKSWAVVNKSSKWNERLEFLGDSILSLIISDYLYRTYPEKDEGFLSKLKSHLVSRTQLAKWAKEIALGKFIYISPAEKSSGGEKKASILANMFESILGAIYIDQGLEKCQKFIEEKFLKKGLKIEFQDYKSLLQEIVQKKFKILPEYKIIKEVGPDHNKKFDAVVKIKGEPVATGEGKTKKEAEQNAAKNALQIIDSFV